MSQAESPTSGVIDWLKKRLSINTHSLPEFIEATKNLNGTYVEGAIIVKVQNLLAGRKTAPELEPIGLDGYFELNGYYTSRTPSGRKIIFKESYETVFGNNKDASVLRTLATLNDRLTAIKDQIPNITTVMKLGTNEISEEAYKEMQKRDIR